MRMKEEEGGERTGDAETCSTPVLLHVVILLMWCTCGEAKGQDPWLIMIASRWVCAFPEILRCFRSHDER